MSARPHVPAKSFGLELVQAYLSLFQPPCSDLILLAHLFGDGTHVNLIVMCTNSVFMKTAAFLFASIVGGKQARMAGVTTSEIRFLDGGRKIRRYADAFTLIVAVY